MLNITPLLRGRFVADALADLSVDTPEGIRHAQIEQLDRLTRCAEHTEYGRTAGIRGGMSYADYAANVPVAEYPDIRPWVERMLHGERDILWPGVCRRFAQSSGTSDGKSKYIPVTADSLRLNHYPGGSAVVSHYLRRNPQSRLFAGKSFILGGSFANEVRDLPRGVRVGDLSANLIEAINPAVNLLRVPSKKIALMEDWTKKLPALARAAATQNITNISGVPSWFLTVLREVLAITGADNIHQVWPNLEVFFHGGISFEPYRELYRSITDPERMHYVETYNASEGFFAVQDTETPRSMLLLLRHGIFYEFVPSSDPSATPVPAWEVEPGRTYSMLISAPNGLWRYAIGDVVRIDTVAPLRITIAGRTKAYINAFGEELMVHNADAALARACDATGARVLNYTAAPVYTSEGSRGRHQWLIEWDVEPPCGIDAFADTLDSMLQQENSDYQAKRSGGIFLDRLSITTARPGLFDAWLASTGKLGGQRKVPRLSNSRDTIESMLALNSRQ